MGNRLAKLLAAPRSVPLWLVVGLAGLTVFAALDPPSAIELLWIAAVSTALVFAVIAVPVRILQHFRGRGMSMREVLGIVSAYHALGLVAWLWGPLNNQMTWSYVAELTGFDRPFLTAFYFLLWALSSILIALRFETFGRFHGTREQFASAVGICGILLLMTIKAKDFIPQFRGLYRSYGPDLPVPTLFLLEIHPYWYVLPLLGAAMACAVMPMPALQTGPRRHVFDGLIGLLVITNLAMVGGLTTMFLPMTKMCSQSLHLLTVETNFTRLHAAASLGHANSIQRLIAGGMPIDVQDNDGETPLLLAIAGGHEQTVRALLANGAKISAANARGYAPLHRAVIAAGQRGSNPDLVRLLLERGADVNPVSASGTPLDSAFMYKQDQLVALLLAHGAVRATEQERKSMEQARDAKLAESRATTVSPSRGCG